MKKFSKILSVALLVALVLSLGITNAFAAGETASITITRDDSYAGSTEASETTYTYYQILKADLSALTSNDYKEDGSPKEGAKVVYYVETGALAEALKATNLFDVVKVEGSSRYNVSLKSSSTTAEQLVTALNVDAIKTAAISTGTFVQTDAGSVTKDQLDKGYYLILASNGTKVALQTLADVTIKEKNQYPNVDKKIKEGETLVIQNDVNIGDIVTYVVPVTIPATVAQKDIVVTDKMFKGLSLNASSLTAVNNAETPETITGLSFSEATVDGDYNIYTVTIPAATVVANAGKTITLTYTATLNSNAVIAGDNPNKVKLQYDNYVTPEHEVITKTYKVEINKITGDATPAKLGGVKFTLTRTVTKEVSGENTQVTEYYVTKNGNNSVWSTTKTEFTTSDQADVNIVFEGLDKGDYVLTETFTPAGFNPLAGPIAVTIGENGAVTYKMPGDQTAKSAETGVIDVVNNSGTVLPSTGGIGTTIFYVVGGVLVLAAIILLVTKKRMSE